jgi:hypothetical protein
MLVENWKPATLPPSGYAPSTKYDFEEDQKFLTLKSEDILFVLDGDAENEWEQDPFDIVTTVGEDRIPVETTTIYNNRLRAKKMNDGDYVVCQCRHACSKVFEFQEMSPCWSKCIGMYISTKCRTNAPGGWACRHCMTTTTT